MRINMLSFLIRLVLLFSTVQNNCEGSKTLDLIELIKGVQLPPEFTAILDEIGKRKICISALECPGGNGCLVADIAGQVFGACINCGLVKKYLDPVVINDGCGSGGGSNSTTTTDTTQTPTPGPGPAPGPAPAPTTTTTQRTTRRTTHSPAPAAPPRYYPCFQLSDCKNYGLGDDYGCATLTVIWKHEPVKFGQYCLSCKEAAEIASLIKQNHREHDGSISVDGCSGTFTNDHSGQSHLLISRAGIFLALSFSILIYLFLMENKST